MTVKKYILIILSVLFVATVAYLYLYSQNVSPLPPSLTPQRPDIPTYVSGQLPIQLGIEEKDFNFPDKLPIVTISPIQISKEYASKIAQNLGFSSSPEEFEDAYEGVKYYWTNDTHSLVITPKTSTVRYSKAESEIPVVVNKGLTDENIISIAKNFLSSNGILDQGKIRAVSVVPYRASNKSEGLEQVSRGLAQVFQVNFTYNLADYHILTIDPSSPIVSVRILPDETIFSAQAILFDTLSRGFTEYSLKNYEEVSASLSEANLMELRNGYAPLTDVSIKDISGLTVEKISLVYLLDAKQTLDLQPVYLLEGPAVVTNSEANYAALYLTAIK